MGNGNGEKSKTTVYVILAAVTLIAATFGATMTFALKTDQEQLVQTVQGLNEAVNNTKLAFSASNLVDIAREKVGLLENEKYELRALNRKYPTDISIKDQITDNKETLTKARADLEKAETNVQTLLNK